MTLAASTTFSALVEQVKKLPLEELRKEAEGYFEFVIAREHLRNLYARFEPFFGTPFKPEGIEPSSKHKDLTVRYGGIQRQQTLYYIEKDGISSCAMIWPWNNGERATVKMAQGVIGKNF